MDVVIDYSPVIAEVHDFVSDVVNSHVTHGTDRKLIDVILETGEDEMTKFGDILVYMTASSSNSTGKGRMLYHSMYITCVVGLQKQSCHISFLK